MPTTEYDVYVNDVDLVTAIEEYCNEHDISGSQFFREAARNQLQIVEGDQA